MSRYTHRVTISNSRLLRFDQTGVTFRYKDYRRAGAERQQVITLVADEFIRRFLLHVLTKGFHRIRHYGLLAGATRKTTLDHVRRLLGVTRRPQTLPRLNRRICARHAYAAAGIWSSARPSSVSASLARHPPQDLYPGRRYHDPAWLARHLPRSANGCGNGWACAGLRRR